MTPILIPRGQKSENRFSQGPKYTELFVINNNLGTFY